VKPATENSSIRPTSGDSDRLYYGWILVAAFTLVMAVAYGANFSFSVFLQPISDWFGWERATTSSPLALSLWISGLMAVVMGLMTDRLGPRSVVLLGAIAGVGGYIVISQTRVLWHLYAGFAITAVNTSSVWTPLVSTTARWFTRRRVLAIGIVTGGIGVGQMFMPPLASFLIQKAGWQTAYIVIAILIGVVTLPAVILCRRPPPAVAEKKEDAGPRKQKNIPITRDLGLAESVRTPAFWLLFFINIAQACVLFMAGMHIAAHAVDTGVSVSAASFTLTFMGGANIAAKLFAGGLADRRGSTFTLLLFIGAEAVALLILAFAGSYWMFFLAAALMGLGIGGATPPLVGLVAEFFGLRSVGAITGLTGVGWAAGCSLGTVIGDVIYDATGSYFTAFLLGVGLTIAAGAMAASLRHPKPPETVQEKG